ncbi:hypothetical protein GGI19_002874 [Coemansia pectinata]|uniref:Lysozyme n=1 Tax=Coemansia pectinata TaxID=1052879 RepID=A0A9W8H1W7_9FUNG|nr:hypothetical protein GGI19_002874 [Coemansia pectinata]
MLLTLFIISAATAAAQIKPASIEPANARAIGCRTSPKDSALIVRTYGDQDVLDIQCRTTIVLTASRTVQWIRTADNCYVPARYMGIDEETSRGIPECATLDALKPCTLPNPAGFDLIQRYEGFLDRPRTDIFSGQTYIGFGHQCVSAKCDQEPVEIQKFPVSKTQGSVLLWQDLQNTTACLARMLSDDIETTSLKLSENMWSALVSWTFSIGCDLAAKSQLVARIRHGESPVAVVAAELPKWSVIHGKPVSDLTTRREAELTLFRTRSSSVAYPHCDQK